MDESPEGSPEVEREVGREVEREVGREVGRASTARPTNVNVIFALTVLPHEAALLRRGRRLVGSEPDARDLVQETMERALRTFHAFRPGTAVWAWLRTIMNSVWIDGWRRRQAAAKICSLPTIDMAAPEPEPTLAAGSDEEILERLPAAIARLPRIFREVLELRLQENRSYGEIADRLGIPSRTVGTRILRARRQLRQILEEESETDGIRPAATATAPPRQGRTLVTVRRGPGASRPANDVAALVPDAVAEKKASWHRARV